MLYNDRYALNERRSSRPSGLTTDATRTTTHDPAAVKRQVYLPLASQATALHLAQSLGTADKRHGANSKHDRQGLEEVPAGVVHEEDKLHADDGTKKGSVRNGSSTNRLGEMVGISTQGKPL